MIEKSNTLIKGSIALERSESKTLADELKELEIKDVPQVGGKNASLGEMYRHLTKKGLRVPNGFATTAWAYNYFLH